VALYPGANLPAQCWLFLVERMLHDVESNRLIR
jgi:hypothetical protein